MQAEARVQSQETISPEDITHGLKCIGCFHDSDAFASRYGIFQLPPNLPYSIRENIEQVGNTNLDELKCYTSIHT